METRTWVISGAALLLLISTYLYWRTIWFFRNPGRTPRGSGLVSPADGRFSGFRVVFRGEIKFIHHYPAAPDNVQMLPMHRRSLFRRTDYARNSLHLLQNERTVTCIEGIYRELRLPCYIVQIAGKRVRGIESFFKPGQQLSRGEIFGMIRIGSQVDIVVPRAVGLKVRVRAGDRVRAGETLLIE